MSSLLRLAVCLPRGGRFWQAGFLSLFAAMLSWSVAVGQQAGRLTPPHPPTPPAAQPASFADLVRQARENFAPPTDAQLAAARAAVVKGMNELQRFVDPNSSNGKLWLKYLRWDAFQQQMAAASPADLAPLAETYRQLNRNENGLELPQFRHLSETLRQAIDLYTLARMEDPAAVYNRQLDALAADIEELRTQPGASPTVDTLRRLDLFAGLGSAQELVAAIRKEFAAPNAFMNVSAAYLSSGAAEPIDRVDPVTDNILGTSIQGTGHTTGMVLIRTVPSADSARISIESQGHVVSSNTGRNGPAVIRSTGVADFTATKQINLSDPAFLASPARVDATYNTDIHSIAKAGGGIGSRLVSSQGWSRANQSRGQVNCIAADHTEDRVGRRIDEDVNKKLRDARKRYEDEYRRPLERQGSLPSDIDFASTADELSVVATQANRAQLGATAAPPELPAGNDLVVRLHASAVNNYSATLLGGATASETQPGQERAKFDVDLPQWMKNAWEKKRTAEPNAAAGDEPFKPTTITFRPIQPITVNFDDNKVKFTVHVSRLTSGDEEFTNWDITGTFTPQLESGGIVLQRDGDLVVLPSSFETERRELTSREVAIRSNLTKVLNERSAKGRGFPARIEFAELKPTGAGKGRSA